MRLVEFVSEKKCVQESFLNVDPTAFDSPAGGGNPDPADGMRQNKISIQVQLRKAFKLDGNYDLQFSNGETAKVDRNTAAQALSKIDNLRTSQEKFNAIKYIEKSYKNLLSFLGLNENLRDWFGKGKTGGAGGGGWDRYNTKGERIGKCGDSKPGEGKPKCLSKSAAAKLRNADRDGDGKRDGKAGIARAVRRKKANDPNPDRRGAAKNVKN